MDKDDLTQLGSAPIGRRRVLQGVAVGGALWAAPSVLTLDRASAATGSAQSCGPLSCAGAGTPCAGNPNPNCTCVELAGGGTGCNAADANGNNGFCNPVGSPSICATDADCLNQFGPANGVCYQFSSDCDQFCGGNTYCGPACAQPMARGAAARGMTARRSNSGAKLVAVPAK